MNWVKEMGAQFASLLTPEDRRRAAGGLLPRAWTPDANSPLGIPAVVVDLLRGHGFSYPVIIDGRLTRSWAIPGDNFNADRVYAEREQQERQRQKYGSWFVPKGAR